MAATLFFPHSFHLGMGPGKAAHIRAGDVIRDIPDALAPMLRSRFGAKDQDPKAVDTVDIADRVLSAEVAAKSSHPLSEQLLKPTQTEILAEAIRDLAAAQKK